MGISLTKARNYLTMKKRNHPGWLLLLGSALIAGSALGQEAGDTTAVSAHAADLRQAAAAMGDLEPQMNQELAAVFDEYRTSVARLATEMIEIAGAGDIAGAGQLIGEVRHTCVSCHVKFRRKVDDNGLFPNIGNLIAGRVRLVKQDGDERQDRANVVVFLDRANSDADLPLPRENPHISQNAFLAVA